MFTLEQAERHIKNYLTTSVVAGQVTGISLGAIISLFTQSKTNNYEQNK